MDCFIVKLVKFTDGKRAHMKAFRFEGKRLKANLEKVESLVAEADCLKKS